jgi:hypothetical protein
MPTKGQIMSQQTAERFLSDYADLLAHYNSTDVFAGVNSFLKLNYTDAELQTATVAPGAYRKILALALITLINRDALEPIVTDFTEAGEKDLDRLRQETGVDADLVAVPPPPPPSTEQLLEDQVRQDFATLPSSKMREKRNNDKRYEAMYQRIADTLGSSVTSLTRAGA